VDAEAEHVPAADSHPALRALVIGAVAVGVLAFVVEERALLGAGRQLEGADRDWLGIAVLSMVALLANQAMFHAAAQRAGRLPTGPFGAVRPALAATFMNQVTKSGGMAGLTMLVADGDRRRLGRAPVVAAYALVAVLTDLAFAGALAAALLMSWVGGHLTGPEAVACAVFAVYLAARTTLIGVAATSRSRLRRMYALPARFLALVRRTPAGEPDTRSADELHDALSIIRREPLRSLPAAGHALAVEAFGVVELWAVIAAVGGGHSLVLALVAYAVSAMFAIVGVLPGGLGFVELSLGAVLVSYGLPTRTAVAAVVLYRVVELVIPVTVGAVAASRLRGPVPAER
jgi:uncharacterized membrane protein YbhN (UPF0104 family)